MTIEFNHQYSAGKISPNDLTIYDADGNEVQRWYGAEIVSVEYKWAELEWHPETDIVCSFIGRDQVIELPAISHDDYLKLQNGFIQMATAAQIVFDNMIEAFEQLSKVMLEVAEAGIKPLLNFWDQLPRDVRWELDRKERNRARYYRRYNRHKGKSK